MVGSHPNGATTSRRRRAPDRDSRRRLEIDLATVTASVGVRQTRRLAPWLLWTNDDPNTCERCGTSGLRWALHYDEREILVDNDLKVHVCGPIARHILGAAIG